MPTGGQSPYPHGAFRAELFPRFLRLCQPPVRVSMTVKAFASKWTGPFALLKVFTSFFPEKQKRICQNLGADEPLLRHSCWSGVSLPSEALTGRLRGAGSRSPRWTVVHHAAQPPAEAHTHGEPRAAKIPKPGDSPQPRVPALAPPRQAPRPGQQSRQGEHRSLDLGRCLTGLIPISLGPTLQSRASSLWATDPLLRPCVPTKRSRKVKLSPSASSSYRSLLKIPAPETQNQTDNPHSLLK